jgi:hypothetical protein
MSSVLPTDPRATTTTVLHPTTTLGELTCGIDLRGVVWWYGAVRKLHQVQMQMAAGHKDAAAMGLNLDDMGPIGTLEINPNHPILRRLSALFPTECEPSKAMAEDIVWQLFDNSKIAAGVLDDPRRWEARSRCRGLVRISVVWAQRPRLNFIPRASDSPSLTGVSSQHAGAPQ